MDKTVDLDLDFVPVRALLAELSWRGMRLTRMSSARGTGSWREAAELLERLYELTDRCLKDFLGKGRALQEAANSNPDVYHARMNAVLATEPPPATKRPASRSRTPDLSTTATDALFNELERRLEHLPDVVVAGVILDPVSGVDFLRPDAVEGLDFMFELLKTRGRLLKRLKPLLPEDVARGETDL
jgi:hypothetical protein